MSKARYRPQEDEVLKQFQAVWAKPAEEVITEFLAAPKPTVTAKHKIADELDLLFLELEPFITLNLRLQVKRPEDREALKAKILALEEKEKIHALMPNEAAFLGCCALNDFEVPQDKAQHYYKIAGKDNLQAIHGLARLKGKNSIHDYCLSLSKKNDEESDEKLRQFTKLATLGIPQSLLHLGKQNNDGRLAAYTYQMAKWGDNKSKGDLVALFSKLPQNRAQDLERYSNPEKIIIFYLALTLGKNSNEDSLTYRYYAVDDFGYLKINTKDQMRSLFNQFAIKDPAFFDNLSYTEDWNTVNSLLDPETAKEVGTRNENYTARVLMLLEKKMPINTINLLSAHLKRSPLPQGEYAEKIKEKRQAIINKSALEEYKKLRTALKEFEAFHSKSPLDHLNEFLVKGTQYFEPFLTKLSFYKTIASSQYFDPFLIQLSSYEKIDSSSMLPPEIKAKLNEIKEKENQTENEKILLFASIFKTNSTKSSEKNLKEIAARSQGGSLAKTLLHIAHRDKKGLEEVIQAEPNNSLALCALAELTKNTVQLKKAAELGSISALITLGSKEEEAKKAQEYYLEAVRRGSDEALTILAKKYAQAGNSCYAACFRYLKDWYGYSGDNPEIVYHQGLGFPDDHRINLRFNDLAQSKPHLLLSIMELYGDNLDQLQPLLKPENYALLSQLILDTIPELGNLFTQYLGDAPRKNKKAGSPGFFSSSSSAPASSIEQPKLNTLINHKI